MYGPPPHARQLMVAAGPLDEPLAWGLCLGAASLLLVAGLAARRRSPTGCALLLMAAQVLALTAPAAALVERCVYGAWPTIDKTGSFLFYQQGVHRRLFAAGAAQAAELKLIGVHVGHLWLTELFDLLLSPQGAFIAQGLAQLWLAWICAWLLFLELGSRSWAAMITAFPFALGLHVFRDLNYYTIEKSAVFGIPLFLWAMNRARLRGGRWIAVAAVVMLGAAWLNLYLALVNAALAGLWLLGARSRRALVTVGCCALSVVPLLALQALLLQDAGALADPQRFLWERAAQDVLSLWPPQWYHLEAWRALNLPLMLLGAWGLWSRRQQDEARYAAGVVVTLGLLAMGPVLLGSAERGIPNLVFNYAWKLIPGFWRVARPEFFFEGAVLVLLASAALWISRQLRGRGQLLALHVLLILGWCWGVRGHPAYPGFAEPVEVELRSGWEQGVFQEP